MVRFHPGPLGQTWSTKSSQERLRGQMDESSHVREILNEIMANNRQERQGNFRVNPDINVTRLKSDLQITEDDLRLVEKLNLPDMIFVSSVSVIKTTVVADALKIIEPNRQFNVLGVKVSSGINEQPLGGETIMGALNRLNNVMKTRLGEERKFACISIENGLFREGSESPKIDMQGTVAFIRGADLTTQFDPDAEYSDRAVTAIKLPNSPIVIEVSPGLESVRFPKSAILAAYSTQGGFTQNTVGSVLEKMRIVQNGQDPHKELTVNRVGGFFSRQDQMARVIIRGLLRAVKYSKLSSS